MKKILYFLLCAFFVAGCGDDPKQEPGPGPGPGPDPDPDPTEEVVAKVDPFTWTSVDALGRTIEPGVNAETPEVRGEKTVGMFYFLWLGCHTYDTGLNYNGDAQPPRPTDVKSPFDIQQLLNANPYDPQYGPESVFHHWGEPYMGYYVSNDEWVIRKHAQMLSDAGVDVVIFDVTNAFTYIKIVKKIGDIYTAMRKEGCKTPQFTFVFNSNMNGTTQSVYQDIYARGLYKDLWFMWDGKPLLLCNPDEVSPSVKRFFTIRHSWFLWNSNADTWFGDGEDKWPWGGWYPQKPGKHGGQNESVSVMPATHPISNIGRSYNVATGVQPTVYKSGEGIYFKSQFERAMKLDPKFLFFTGWNEWVAQRFISEQGGQPMLGRTLPPGGSFFVDQYNHEFSRDMEPLKGDFGDNYYYQLADYIRRFKGTKPLPTYSKNYAIAIDGDMKEWRGVESAYGDDKGDVTHRNHYGYGGAGQLVNTTGRNDIIQAKVANDGVNLYFYVKTAEKITSYKDKNWMQLLIHVQGSKAADWQGFQYQANWKPKTELITTLAQCGSDQNKIWEECADINYRVTNNELELAIPLKDLGLSQTANAFNIDFKWVDNTFSKKEDIQECLTDGDAAPNGRFRYRYQFQKK